MTIMINFLILNSTSYIFWWVSIDFLKTKHQKETEKKTQKNRCLKGALLLTQQLAITLSRVSLGIQ